jgi:hypothetical protein
MTVRQIVTRLGEYETVTPFELEERSEGVYIQHLHIQGNSLLSSVFVESLSAGASVKVDYFDTTTGAEVGEEYLLGAHPTIVNSGITHRLTVTRIHQMPRVRVTVTGGTATFGVLVTVVTSFATDLDAALVSDGQEADLLRDKSIPIAGYNDDNTYEFIRVKNGILQVGGSVTTDEQFINRRLYNEVLGKLPNGDTKLIDYTVPVGKTFQWTSGFGNSNNWCDFHVSVNGLTWIFKSNSFDSPNVDLSLGRGVTLSSGDVLEVFVKNTNIYNQPANIRVGIFGVEL